MAMSDDQKSLRYDLENKADLTPKERVLLAALNDLKEADASGKDLPQAAQAVKDAQAEVDEERNGKVTDREVSDEDSVAGGGENVRRVKANQNA